MSSQSLLLKAYEGKTEEFLLLKFIGLIFFVCVHGAGIEVYLWMLVIRGEFSGVCVYQIAHLEICHCLIIYSDFFKKLCIFAP